MKGARDLDAPGRGGAARALGGARRSRASALDRPPFKVMPEQSMVEVAPPARESEQELCACPASRPSCCGAWARRCWPRSARDSRPPLKGRHVRTPPLARRRHAPALRRAPGRLLPPECAIDRRVRGYALHVAARLHGRGTSSVQRSTGRPVPLRAQAAAAEGPALSAASAATGDPGSGRRGGRGSAPSGTLTSGRSSSRAAAQALRAPVPGAPRSARDELDESDCAGPSAHRAGRLTPGA